MTKTYVSVESYPYEPSEILYVSGNLEKTIDFTKSEIIKLNSDRYEFYIEVWEDDNKLETLYWDKYDKIFTATPNDPDYYVETEMKVKVLNKEFCEVDGNIFCRKDDIFPVLKNFKGTLVIRLINDREKYIGKISEDGVISIHNANVELL